jgi:putative acetyltransferase
MHDHEAIRREQPGDEHGIHELHIAAFPTPVEARLVDGLRAVGQVPVSIVCAIDARIVGHAAFSPVTAANGATGLGLAPVAVLASHRRRGIAGRIIRAGLDAARAAGCAWVVVMGDPAYYGRFGFAPAPRHGLSDAYGGGPCFQVMGLIPGGIPTGGGLVRYSPVFAQVGC